MKKTKGLRTICCLLVLMLIFTGNTRVKAEGMDLDLYISEKLEDVELVPGTVQHMKVPVQSRGTLTYTNCVEKVEICSAGDQKVPDVTIKNTKLVRKDSLYMDDTINFSSPTYVEFDVHVGESAKIGRYYFKITISSMYQDFKDATVQVPCHISTELQEAELDITSFQYKKEDAVIGNSLDLSFTIKNAGQMKAMSAYISLEFPTSEAAGKEIVPKYSTTKVKIGNLKPNESNTITLPVQISPKATKGTKTLKATFTYKDESGNEGSNTVDVFMDITGNEKAPELTFNQIDYTGEFYPGDKLNVVVNLKNIGDSAAKNVKLSVTDGISADSIMPDFTASSIRVDTIKKKDSKKVTIPLKVSKDAAKGTKAITIVLTYQDDSMVEYTNKTVIYPEVHTVEKEEKKEEKKEGKPNVIIKNVNQLPSVPSAGGQVTLSFDVINQSKVKVKEFKIGAGALTADTFSPVSSDPYIYFNQIAGGEKKHISMTFTISKNITEGFHAVPLEYSYVYGKEATEESKTASLNVLEIENNQEDLSKSVPKLIISDYSTDVADLRAGQTFLFTYEIKNTHNSVAAKNIKVTVSQADNIFNVANGSNSSYIDMIAPNSSNTCEIELKVKSDAATKAYPLTITMQYEYDGAEVSPVTGKVGEEVVETINLIAVEDSRPEVENLYIDDWNMPTVGQSILLNFQFYNMGKSTLSNVYATISGDFEKTDGDKQIIGNVNPGDSQPVEVDVTPLVEGEAVGIVTITFEDSNGDEQTMTKEFTANIMPQSGFDPGMDDPTNGMIDPMPTAKKPILPVWAFVLVQVGIFVIVTPVVRGVKIKRYKKKLEKQEEEI